MWKAFQTAKGLGLVAVVATTAVIVPLYGDPRSVPVTHAEWGRMMLRALDMEDVLPARAQASTVFSILSWKSSLAYPAEDFAQAEGVRVIEDRGRRAVVAQEGPGEVSYRLAVVRGGDYKLRLRARGNPAVPVAAEIRLTGQTKPVGTFSAAPSRDSSWIDAGSSHLDRGVYTASVLLPAGTALERLEVAPPCLSAIEPPGGWRATAITLASDVAVTAVKAIDKEFELPPAAAPIELRGSDFQVSGAGSVILAAASSGAGAQALHAAPQGTRALVVVQLPVDGLYTFWVFGIEGRGQKWTADACHKAVLCGTSSTASDLAWRPMMTSAFAAGRHVISVMLAPGAVVERLRVERRKDTPADYAATLRRLGFDVGPEGPMARGGAVDAIRFIQSQRRQSTGGPCGDIEGQLPALSARADAGLAEPAPIAGPGRPPLNPGSGPPPLSPPAVPPQIPGSPVTP